jgi:hypothetical protein
MVWLFKAYHSRVLRFDHSQGFSVMRPSVFVLAVVISVSVFGPGRLSLDIGSRCEF